MKDNIYNNARRVLNELTREQWVDIFKHAKDRYIEMFAAKEMKTGMCWHITVVLSMYTGIRISVMQAIVYSDIPFIPEFTPEFLGSKVLNRQEYAYWWAILDMESRIQAFDKLIEAYSNGKNKH